MAQLPMTPQHTLCPQCQHRIVRATTRDGHELALDTGLRTYHLILNADNTTYRAEPASGYAVHACPGKES